MKNEIRYSYYNNPQLPIDTVITIGQNSVMLIHNHEDSDAGALMHLSFKPVDVVLGMIQTALDIIYREDGWLELENNVFTEYNTNALIAWNNALIEAGIIPNYEGR